MSLENCLHHLESSVDSAARNMATDQLLLEAYPSSGLPRFRHYGWTEPAYTFGFAQAWGAELEGLARSYAVIRRETGGGLVDHREDWTWSFVLPLSHPAAEEGLTCLYNALHRALHHALRAQDVPARMQALAPAPLKQGVFRECFSRAERDDVILPDGRKVAGAAQRRTKAGILAQGYINRGALPKLDWQRFELEFVQQIGHWLQCRPEPRPMPDLQNGQLELLASRFASDAWNRYRRRNR